MADKDIRKIEDDVLSTVVGGTGNLDFDAGEISASRASRIAFACRKAGCGEIFYIKAGDNVAVCPKCKARYKIEG